MKVSMSTCANVRLQGFVKATVKRVSAYCLRVSVKRDRYHKFSDQRFQINSWKLFAENIGRLNQKKEPTVDTVTCFFFLLFSLPFRFSFFLPSFPFIFSVYLLFFFILSSFLPSSPFICSVFLPSFSLPFIFFLFFLFSFVLSFFLSFFHFSFFLFSFKFLLWCIHFLIPLFVYRKTWIWENRPSIVVWLLQALVLV